MLALPSPRKIRYPALCEAVIDYVANHAAGLPRHVIRAGAYVRRTVSRNRMHNPLTGNIIYSEPGGDRNRMDGGTPRGATRPALYLSLDDHATLAENLHYSGHRSTMPVIQYKQLEEKAPLWLPEKTVLTLRVRRPLAVADLRRDNAAGMQFLREMNADPGMKAALRKAGYGHVLLGLYHEEDYSTARGIAYAADRTLGLAGMLFNTARISQHGERFADNLALFGEYQRPLTDVVVIAAEEFRTDPATGKAVPSVTYLDPALKPTGFPAFTSEST